MNAVLLYLEAFFKYLRYVLRFTHRVEMHCRDSVSEKVLALLGTPLRSDSVNGLLVVLGFCQHLCQFERNVKRKCLRKDCDLS